MKIKEKRILTMEAVRGFCIKNNLYTKGNNDEYTAMLKMCKGTMTINKFYKIANNIIEHSDVLETLETYGVTKTEWIENCMYELTKLSYSTFEILN